MSGRAGPPPLRAGDHPFLHGLDAAFVERIAHGAREVAYDPGDMLFREGEGAERFYLVFQGKVALEIETPERPRLTIQTVGPGDVVGWSWLFAPHRWRFDARAVKATRVLALEAPTVRAALDAHPIEGYRFLLRLLPVLGERLEMARLQILDIHGG
ncbi:MAG TPA: cyclic nucleotide-binding domain-containing protein [Thermoplasmata archaeon]|nr:cyclic nucleotide-binding domain-containing protein [Thermoplasmata archaeon]